MNVMVGRRALFTCLTTRAVHLELAHKLDYDDCILCFSNFMNNRGRPRHKYCDHGTNFVATERVLREELQNFNIKQIADSFAGPELSFHFNPPSLSPHMGGHWKRLVKAVKVALYDALPSRTPTDPLLRSCLISAENIVNSRPLTYLPLDFEESETLTPNHFLVGCSNGAKTMAKLDNDAKHKVSTQVQERELSKYLIRCGEIYFGLHAKEVRKLAYELTIKYNLTQPTT
ncbi:hypothetical protein JTB14_022703 [Gonioctena quinquepunctata]|nr:hypothetical protein JTB14_022703 [Gonioctena quinquepunctata]